MALQLADKLANFVENNERLWELKQGRDVFYGRGGGRGFGDRPPFPRGDRVGGGGPGQGGFGRGGGGAGGSAWGNRRDNRGPPREQRGPIRR